MLAPGTLVVHPPAQLLERNHDCPPVRITRTQALVPGIDVGTARHRDAHAEVTIERRARRYVREREIRSCKIRPARKLPVEQCEEPVAFVYDGLETRGVPA